MKYLITIIALILSGCSTTRYEWRASDGSQDLTQIKADQKQCVLATQHVRAGAGTFDNGPNRCMKQLGYSIYAVEE